MNRFILCLFFLSINFWSYSQTFEWVKTFGGASGDTPVSIKIDNQGNIITYGWFVSTTDFDPGPLVYNLSPVGIRSIFISKLDSDGNFIWAKSFGVTGTNWFMPVTLEIDNNDNLYFTGRIDQPLDFDDGIDTSMITPIGDFDLFVCKYNSSGIFQWVFNVGGNSTIVDVKDLEIGTNNCFYLTGEFTDSADFDPGIDTFKLSSDFNITNYDIFIAKYDLNGNFKWAKQQSGGDYDFSVSLDVDQYDNVYNSGKFKFTLDADPGTNSYNLVSLGNTDVYVSKLDSNGNFVWAKSFGGAGSGSDDLARSVTVDTQGNCIVTGRFASNVPVDLDPGAASFIVNSISNREFVLVLNEFGNFIRAFNWKIVETKVLLDDFGNIYFTGGLTSGGDFDPGIGNQFSSYTQAAFVCKHNSSNEFEMFYLIPGNGGVDEKGFDLALDNNGNIFCYGQFDGTVDFDINQGTLNVSGNTSDIFIHKVNQSGVRGKIFSDVNQNCDYSINELGIPHRNAIIQPGNIIIQTDQNGDWFLDSLPPGNYSIEVDTSGNWMNSCANIHYFTVVNNELTQVSPIGLISTQPCSQSNVSVMMPQMIRCFTNQKIFISAGNENNASSNLDSAKLIVSLDTLISITSMNFPFVGLGNNTFQIDLGTILPGQFHEIKMDADVSCDAVLGQTLCVEANLLPVDSCSLSEFIPNNSGSVSDCTLPWDHSNISVDGWCDNDSIYFVISNSGSGNMMCYSEYRIFVDGYNISLDSFQLQNSDSDTLIFSGDGRTWRLEADQHPLHPGNSHPNATIELCGSDTNWTPDLVNILPPDDAEGFIDIFCGLVSGSYDPNSKTGYPLGITDTHYISSNQQMEYIIHFQNTGTDTAHTVVIRDTLEMDFDIFSVHSGASSHPYSFVKTGPRVLEWTFSNIMLPDSTTNEEGSHGYVAFTVNQNPNLIPGSELNNEVGIYFDFNSPIITNLTSHIIKNTNFNLGVSEFFREKDKLDVKLFPNPSAGTFFLMFDQNIGDLVVNITNVIGQCVFQEKYSFSTLLEINSKLISGVYLVEIKSGDHRIKVLKMIIN